MEEMIEKQVTVLVPKSDEERFDSLIKGFKSFYLESYNKEQVFKRKTLSIELRSIVLENDK